MVSGIRKFTELNKLKMEKVTSNKMTKLFTTANDRKKVSLDQMLSWKISPNTSHNMTIKHKEKFKQKLDTAEWPTLEDMHGD